MLTQVTFKPLSLLEYECRRTPMASSVWLSPRSTNSSSPPDMCIPALPSGSGSWLFHPVFNCLMIALPFGGNNTVQSPGGFLSGSLGAANHQIRKPQSCHRERPRLSSALRLLQLRTQVWSPDLPGLLGLSQVKVNDWRGFRRSATFSLHFRVGASNCFMVLLSPTFCAALLYSEI